MEENPDTIQSKTEDAPVHPFAEFLPEMNPADFPLIHPLAKEFPMLSAQELKELAEDIKVRGQLAPILNYQGAILDGRNRWVACRMAGVEPETIEYKEADPVGFIKSMNILRRHLTTAERARLAELLATASHGGDHSGSESTLAKTAKELDVSRTSVATVRKIKKKSPKAYNDLKRGKHKSVNAAAKAAGLTKSKGSKAFRSADKAAEIEPVQSENNIVQRLNAGEIPAEVTAEVHFWHFEKLKTFGAEVSDAAKGRPIIHVLWKAVESSFEASLKEIFPKLQAREDLNLTSKSVTDVLMDRLAEKTGEDRATMIARGFRDALIQWYEAAHNVPDVTKEELAKGFSKGLKEFGKIQNAKLQKDGKPEEFKPDSEPKA
jgi:hypothetical protein